jgi:hypothetical protein
MGAAYYIVLDNESPGFETFVNGKAVTREMDAISALAEARGLADIHDFASFADLAEAFDIDADLPAAQEKWFDANEGVAWTQAIREAIQANPAAVRDAAAVTSDLQQYERVLRQAAAIGAKWHLAMDA